MNHAQRQDQPTWVSLVGLIGFIFMSIALFQSIHNSSGSILTSIIIYVIVCLIGFSLWAGAFSFLGFIPVLSVIWVVIGIGFMYAFPLLIWFS